MADGSVIIDTKLDNTGLKKDISNLEGSFSKLKGTITKVIGVLGLSKLAKDGIKYNATIEQLSTSFEVMTGSASKASKVIKELKEFGAKTPYELTGLANTTQLLMQYGFTADDAIATTKQLGDISQGSADKMTSIATGFAQMSSAGKVNLQDIKQMINGGFNPLQEIAKSTGESMESLYNRVSKGTLSIDEIRESMVRATSEGGQFFQSMEKQSGTLNGQLSTLKDNFMEFLGNALQPISDLLKNYLIPTINDILTGGQNLKKMIKEHQTAISIIIGVIGTLTVAIIAFIIQQNIATIALGAYTTAVTVATTASTAFATVMAFITSPVTLVILAIGALITIVVLLIKNWDTIKEKTIEVWGRIKDFIKNAIDNIINWFKELPNRIGTFVKNLIDVVVNWFETLPYKIGFLIGELLGKMIQFGIDAKDWVMNKLPEIINNIIDWFKTLPSRLWNALINALDTMVKWQIEMRIKASEGAKNVVQSIISFFKDLPSNMLNIGRNIVEGLWNGIKNAGNWIKNKVKDFAKGILDGMKSALGIHSPSTLFRDQIGKNIALGVGEGFERNIANVYSRMKSEVDFQTQKLSANLSTTANVSRTLNANFSMKAGDVYLDSTLVGRTIAPAISKTLRTAGV